MQRFLRSVLTLCLLLSAASAAAAVTVEVVPGSQVVASGDQLSVDVAVSGLGELSAPSVGAFDIALCFNADILSFVGVSFGELLGDEGAAEAVTGFSTVGGLTVFEVSLLLPEELVALQPGTFTLFTVTFDATAEGTSPLDLAITALGDENGDPLTADVAGGSVTVGDFCVPDSGTLCLGAGRFSVEVDWRDFRGRTGSGRVVPLASIDSGLFWFFGPENWEVLIKVLDGCEINGHFWVFGAATSNVEYTIRVVDNLTGGTTSYFNPLGNDAGTITDTTAFATCSDAAVGTERLVRLDARGSGVRYQVSAENVGVQQTCTSSSTRLCLQQNRFLVEVAWRDFSDRSASARVVPTSSEQAGLLWFFGPKNWEMLVKVLDACDLNGRFWVFSASATNVEYSLRITDTETGDVKEYFNPLGRANDAIIDVDAFTGCP